MVSDDRRGCDAGGFEGMEVVCRRKCACRFTMFRAMISGRTG